MFRPILDVLVATLRRINSLRYIRNVDIDRETAAGSENDVYVTEVNAEIGDFGELYIPVNAPAQPPTATADYRPLPDVPLVLRLRPRILIPMPGNSAFDPTLVALGCMHALSFTDGALTTFMSQEHELPSSTQGNSGFMWATYKLDTVKVLRIGPIDTPLGIEIQLLIEGMILLHPPAAPTPQIIDEIRPPAEPPPPATEIPRGKDKIVRVVDDVED
jgi:hypothetical protein